MTQPLTSRQAEVYAAILRHAVRCGEVPTTRELAIAMGFATQTGCQCHLQALAKKGYVTLNAYRSYSVPSLADAVKSEAAKAIDEMVAKSRAEAER